MGTWELPIVCSGCGYRASGRDGAPHWLSSAGDSDRLAAEGVSVLLDLAETSISGAQRSKKRGNGAIGFKARNVKSDLFPESTTHSI